MSNSVVKAIGDLSLKGNIIPRTWFEHKIFRYKNGKINLNAIIILSDILYWYRPVLIIDETTNKLEQVRSKFKSDKLQKNYKNWGENFGLSKRQVQEACYFLQKHDLITVECRDITVNNITHRSVTFFEPVVKNIQKVTELSKAVRNSYKTDEDIMDKWEGVTLESDTCHVIKGDVSHPNGTRVTLERELPKSTTESTTDLIDDFTETPEVLKTPLPKKPVPWEEIREVLDRDGIIAAMQLRKLHDTSRHRKKTDFHARLMTMIDVLTSNAYYPGKEATGAEKLVELVDRGNYTEEEIYKCVDWARETGEFNYGGVSLINLVKILPKYRDRDNSIKSRFENKEDRKTRIYAERDYEQIDKDAADEFIVRYNELNRKN